MIKTWKTKTGARIKIADMSDQHLENVLDIL